METTSEATPANFAAPSGFPDLRRFFAPRRMAMVGATEDLSKFGGRCMRQLIDFGFAGEIYPVNPNRDEVLGKRCYASIAALPQTPDHVGIVLPAHAVPAAIEQCAERDVPFATVFSSGFGETGTDEGRRAQQRLVDIARAGNIRLMGPNCNGMINFVDPFALTSTATINGPRRAAGDIGIVGQSGGAAQVNVMWRAQQLGLGISYQVSCGNAADIDMLDYAAFMVESPETRVVLILAERIADGEKLRALAQRAAFLDKPLVMVKAGRTEAGSRAAASHTGAVTGADAVCDAALAQLGILRVEDYRDLYETAMLLRRGRRPAGNRGAAISISGGNLVLLADLGAAYGITWPDYTTGTQAELAEMLPGFGVASNPTDLTAASIGQTGKFAAAAKTILKDPAVDLLVPVLTIAHSSEINALAALSESSDKPMAIVWTGCASDDPNLTQERLVAAGHAVYRDTLPCVKAVQASIRYSSFRTRLAEAPLQRPNGTIPAAARAMLARASGPLSEHQSKALLRCYGLPTTRESLATSVDHAVQCAASLDGPVALKIQSPDLPHKTEAGALRLNVVGDAAVRRAYDEVMGAALAHRPDARIEGVLVQEMIIDAQEMLVGITRDPTFGPVMTVGLGGIYVEVLKDVAFRLPPFGPGEAMSALRELRAFGLLEGARGRPVGDLDALADCIARMSWLAVDLQDLIAELDINPLCVLPQGHGVRIVDALVIPRQADAAA